MKNPRYASSITLVVGLLFVLSLSACVTTTQQQQQQQEEGWMADNGYIQWHPQVGKQVLSTMGTQCYFCQKAKEATVVSDNVPVQSPKAPDPVIKENNKCPNPPYGAQVDAEGCWILKNLHFKFDKSDIDPKAYPVLDEVVTVLNNTRNSNVLIEIHGHTDSTGTVVYNDGLARRRATAVLNYLLKHGVDIQRLTAVGFGLHNPMAPNDTKEGRALNRRVELKPRM
ncbi:MAG: OmpA family protein [Magnetococcales bacterium]|nr:OmpA family protein [Magnetococcales bacterium]